MDKEKFGKFICELRKVQGMTQKDLGDKLLNTFKLCFQDEVKDWRLKDNYIEAIFTE